MADRDRGGRLRRRRWLRRPHRRAPPDASRASRSSSSKRATASAGASGPTISPTARRSIAAAAGSAPQHDAIFALAREVGVSTYKTYVAGDHLLVGDGRIRRYRGLIPKISPAAILTLVLANARLDRMGQARSRRRAVDGQARRGMGRALGRLVSRAVGHSHARSRAISSSRRCAACSPATCTRSRCSTCSSSIRAHGSINTLFSISGGAQENLVVGGAGSIAKRVADDLGAAVRLNTPVRAIRQKAGSRRRGDRADARSNAGLTVSARHAIVTVPRRWRWRSRSIPSCRRTA